MKAFLLLVAGLVMAAPAYSAQAKKVTNYIQNKLINKWTSEGIACRDNGGIVISSAYKKENGKFVKDKNNKKINATDSDRNWKRYSATGNNCYGEVAKYSKENKNGKRLYYLRFTNYNCQYVTVGIVEDSWGDYDQKKKGALQTYDLGQEGRTSTIIQLNDATMSGDKDSYIFITNQNGGSCAKVGVKF